MISFETTFKFKIKCIESGLSRPIAQHRVQLVFANTTCMMKIMAKSLVPFQIQRFTKVAVRWFEKIPISIHCISRVHESMTFMHLSIHGGRVANALPFNARGDGFWLTHSPSMLEVTGSGPPSATFHTSISRIDSVSGIERLEMVCVALQKSEL